MKLNGFVLALVCLLMSPALAPAASITVRGAVHKHLDLSGQELTKMAPFHIEKVTLLQEKKGPGDPEKLISGLVSYKGVLLRDVLARAGTKYVRKFEPDVFMRLIPPLSDIYIALPSCFEPSYHGRLHP